MGRFSKLHRSSKTALQKLDAKLQRHLPETGFFVEAGAFDGVEQSNTYFLERIKGWTGLLIEPVPEACEACRRARPASRVVNCALVADSGTAPEVAMWSVGLMSLVVGARESHEGGDEAYVRAGAEVQGIEPARISVRGRTLSEVISECGSPEIDFLSLDVEGSEGEALRGLDLTRHSPRFVLVEVWKRDPAQLEEVDSILSPTHERVGFLTGHDLLFRRREPAGG